MKELLIGLMFLTYPRQSPFAFMVDPYCEPLIGKVRSVNEMTISNSQGRTIDKVLYLYDIQGKILRKVDSTWIGVEDCDLLSPSKGHPCLEEYSYSGELLTRFTRSYLGADYIHIFDFKYDKKGRFLSEVYYPSEDSSAFQFITKVLYDDKTLKSTAVTTFRSELEEPYNYSLFTTYNKHGKVIYERIKRGGNVIPRSYLYNKNGSLACINQRSKFGNVLYKFDSLGRMISNSDTKYQYLNIDLNGNYLKKIASLILR